jgi:succinate dehydrogenase / fumarate reductase flavoprotein subunit
MLDLVVVNGQARGIVVRNLVTGEFERYAGEAVLLCTGGYGNVYYLSTNAKNSNVTAAWRCHKRGAYFANPCYTQIHPTCIPVSGDYQSKLTLMSEGLRNDGRVWVPKQPGDTRSPNEIPEAERDYYLETRYPAFGNLVPRDVASRNAKLMTDQGRGVGETGLSVYLDFRDAIGDQGRDAIAAKYGNLFDMYQRISGENPYQVPMRIYPAVHYAMGWPLGGLPPDEHCPRSVCAGGSQFFGSWGQSPGGQCPDAGVGRWLFRDPLHPGGLHRQSATPDGLHRRRCLCRSGGQC